MLAADYFEGYGGPDLPDDAIVVRGGTMAIAQLQNNAQTHYDEYQEYALSVFSAPDMSVDELAVLADQPHGKIRISTCGRIRSAGYEIVRSEAEGGPGHADIKLPGKPSDDVLQGIADLFDEPQPNPQHARDDLPT